MKFKNIYALLLIAFLGFTSCTSINKSMREPFVKVEMEKSDFTLSEQLTAEAKTTKILSIDWERLFMSKAANTEKDGSLGISFASIPVVGGLISDKTVNYALYELMTANPGYDVVFYPQYEITVKKPIGIGFIMKETTVKATARLGKLNQ